MMDANKIPLNEVIATWLALADDISRRSIGIGDLLDRVDLANRMIALKVHDDKGAPPAWPATAALCAMRAAAESLRVAWYAADACRLALEKAGNDNSVGI